MLTSPSKCRKLNVNGDGDVYQNGKAHDVDAVNRNGHHENHRDHHAERNGHHIQSSESTFPQNEHKNGVRSSKPAKHQTTKIEGSCYSMLNWKIQEMSGRGLTVYNMSIGQSPFPVMAEAIEALKEHCHLGKYAPVMGVPELRSLICDFHAEHDHVTYQAEDVVVGPGTKLLIDLLISVFDGEIVVTSPSWPSYSAQSRRSDKPFTVLPTYPEDNWSLRADVLQKYLCDREDDDRILLIICTPNNPAGTVYSESQLRKLSDVCRQYDVAVLSDEIYSRLYPDHISIAKYYPEGTILSSGFSKWAAVGGWRVGYHMYPPLLHSLRDRVMGLGTHTYSCCPTPVQMALVKVLRNKSAIADYLFHVGRVLRACVQYTYSELTEVGVQMVNPSGGYFVLADFSCIRASLAEQGIRTGDAMCQKILHETNVGFVSGASFYRPASELTARLVLVCLDGEKALTASRGLKNQTGELDEGFVREHCDQLYTAIQVLKRWVASQQKQCD